MSAASSLRCSPERRSASRIEAQVAIFFEKAWSLAGDALGCRVLRTVRSKAMIYCVVPKPLAEELYPKLVKRYENDDNVTVIIDRREADRRARGSRPSEAELQRRVIRDRRRARVPGDLPPLVDGS